jgi:hypothetical protein
MADNDPQWPPRGAGRNYWDTRHPQESFPGQTRPSFGQTYPAQRQAGDSSQPRVIWTRTPQQSGPSGVSSPPLVSGQQIGEGRAGSEAQLLVTMAIGITAIYMINQYERYNAYARMVGEGNASVRSFRVYQRQVVNLRRAQPRVSLPRARLAGALAFLFGVLAYITHSGPWGLLAAGWVTVVLICLRHRKIPAAQLGELNSQHAAGLYRR